MRFSATMIHSMTYSPTIFPQYGRLGSGYHKDNYHSPFVIQMGNSVIKFLKKFCCSDVIDKCHDVT